MPAEGELMLRRSEDIRRRGGSTVVSMACQVEWLWPTPPEDYHGVPPKCSANVVVEVGCLALAAWHWVLSKVISQSIYSSLLNDWVGYHCKVAHANKKQKSFTLRRAQTWWSYQIVEVQVAYAHHTQPTRLALTIAYLACVVSVMS